MKRGEMQEPAAHIVMATAYLRSATGDSLLAAGPTALSDPRPFRPSADTVERAVAALEQRGFTVEGRGLTLSISGPARLFEQQCEVRIWSEEHTLLDPVRCRPRTVRTFHSSPTVMRIPGLEDLVEGIVLATPGIPFSEGDRVGF